MLFYGQCLFTVAMQGRFVTVERAVLARVGEKPFYFSKRRKGRKSYGAG